MIARPRLPGRFGEESPLTTPTEMLSREHALIQRLMIAMESMVAKAVDNPSIDLHPVNHAAITIKEFGVQHHMADEERFIFPKLRETGEMGPLIDTLLTQHDRAREIIERIIVLTRPGPVEDLGRRNEVIDLCMSFVIMYRAHAAWEETVLFPAFFSVATAGDIREIGRRMREEELELMSDAGLRKLMGRLHDIEAAAGTAELDGFTPRRA